MATCGGDMDLRDDLIGRLAESISVTNMKTIAINYLKISFETVENIRSNHREDAVALNRSLLNLWRYMNPGGNQVQVSFGKTSISRVILQHFS